MRKSTMFSNLQNLMLLIVMAALNKWFDNKKEDILSQLLSITHKQVFINLMDMVQKVF